MAGIYDRIGGDDNIPVHLLMAVLTAVEEGDASNAQALAALNEQVQSDLAGAEITDLVNLAAQLSAAGGVAGKLRYLNLIHSYAMMVEMGVSAITEPAFRNRLGI